jgi:uncharacterized protein (TIGR02145 family)
MGGLEEPKSGALLDLNSTTKGGLLLSNVVLDNLYTIPHDDANLFPGVDGSNYDSKTVKDGFSGAIVYHTGENGIPAGVYVWNGTNWTPAEENCMPLDAGSLTVRASSTFVKIGANVTFSVSSGAGSRCAEGETYDWHVNGTPSASTAWPASTWTTFFTTADTYKVQVKASNRYGDPSSKVSSNEVTVYVTTDGGVPSELVGGSDGIRGGYCYDVKVTQRSGESGADYAARVDSFATGFEKTFNFIPLSVFTNLSVLMPDDPDGIVASVSQPPNTSGNGSTLNPFTVTFKDNVRDLVVNNGPATVKLLVSYMINSAPKIAYLDIRVQDAGCYCPAQVPTGINRFGSLIFMCRNLGATIDIRSVAELGNINASNFYEYHGDWYRFGVHTASLENTSATGTGTITDWTVLSNEHFPYLDPSDGDWPETPSGPFGNPCPSGWRLPTHDEWGAVINTSRNGGNSFSLVNPANNKLTRKKGTANNSGWSSGNHNNILQIGDYLFLPAAGRRNINLGNLEGRGQLGEYWSSISAGAGSDGYGEGWFMDFTNNAQLVSHTNSRNGFSVRCVQAE